VQGKKIRLNKNKVPEYLFSTLKNHDGKTLKVSKNFGDGFENDPEINKNQCNTLVKNIVDAFSENDPIKIIDKKYVKKFAGHVFVEENGQFKIRKDFFTDQILPENIIYFRDELLQKKK
jgi:hypothetical protein